MSGGAPLGTVEVEVKANLDKLVAGFAKGKGEAQKFSNEMVTVNRYASQMADAQVKAAASVAQMRAQQLATAEAINRVTRAINPAIASTRLVSSAVRDAEKAYMAGSISAGALARAQAMGAPWLAKTAAASEKVATSQGRMGGSFLSSARNARFLIAAIGVSLVGGLASMISQVAASTAAIADQAREVGLTSRQLQEYRGIAKDVGLAADDMDGIFKALNHTVDEAATKSPQAVKVFKLLGISLKDARGEMKSTDELFKESIDRLGQVGNKAERAAGAAAIFGEAYGPKMAQLIDQGSEGIDNLRRAVAATGIVLSDEQIQKADQTAKKLDQVKEVLSAKIAAAVVDNAEAIGTLADAFAYLSTKAIQGASDYIKAIHNIKRNGFPVGFGTLGHIGGSNTPQHITVDLPGATPATPEQEARFGGGKAKPKGPNISLANLNAPKGGGGRHHQPVENQFDREEMREQEEHLKLLRDRTGNLVEQNDIDKQLIDLDLKQRVEQLRQMVDHKSLTKAQAAQIEAQDRANAALQKEAADRKMREALIEQSYRGAQESLELEQEGLGIDLRLARTDKERARIELAILASKQQQARSELEKQITLAKEARDETRVAELTEQLAILRGQQLKDVKAFGQEHLTGIAKFKNELPKTVDEINESIDRIRFDLFTERLQRAADMAQDIGDAFGNFAGSLARFESPLKALQSLIGDLADTFTKNFIEKPVSDWATKNIGMPLAKQGFGKDLTTGPDALTVQQMNVALALATQDLNMLAAAAQAASVSMGSANATGAAASADALASSANTATGALNEQTPAIGQFGGALTQLISSLAGGGGGGGGGIFGALLNIGMSALSGSIGGGGAMGGMSAATAATATDNFTLGMMGGFSGLGFAGGGSGVFGGLPGHDRNVLSMNGKPFLRVSKGERFNVDSIATSRMGGFDPRMLRELLGQRGGTTSHIHFGDIVIKGAHDDRSARRAGKQALGEIQRGLAQVSHQGLNK